MKSLVHLLKVQTKAINNSVFKNAACFTGFAVNAKLNNKSSTHFF